ncbi:carbohydrate ABC transporter permease [Vibrio mediterranei]|uniref:carbohydrate ABC transporter permease n=1 Tax=Vibrio mediterranei TaxID=689 RepID=UPI00148D221B|nr:sugar ABC transporter permease [Vibrio mediterranei]NOH31321.1 sugar ABC transporter permease [Vibrio mediterranei]
MQHSNRTNMMFFMVPALLLLTITSLYPVVYGFSLSFYDWNWGTQKNFIGLENYVNLLSSSEFWNSLFNTVRFAVSACIVEISLGFYLASQVDKLKINTNVIQALLMTPLMMSGIVVALLSKTMFDPFSGIFNYFITEFGYSPSAFFGAEESAMFTVILVDIWWQTAFVFIIALAGLKSLPEEPINAARLEGASSLRIFWNIKIPMLKPLITTLVLIRSIDTLKIFDIVFGTTGGGPGDTTEVVQTLAYRTAYGYLQIGKAMTIMVLFSLLIVAISMIYQRVSNEESS